ncbi:MAG: AI-2E family transporter [Acidobacteriota bacterium]|nr:AI-2E family transporter [Acidobacteriota bacterium]
MKLPFFAKAAIFFVGIYALLSMLYISRTIVVPLIFAIIIAIVLHPVVDFLVRKKFNRVLAIIIAMLLVFVILAAFGGFFVSQAGRFGESWPVLVEKFTGSLNQAVASISSYFDLNPQKFQAWLAKTQGELVNTGTAAIGRTLVALGNWIVLLLLIPVYIFLILLYQPLLLEFIRRLFRAQEQSQVNEVVTQTKSVIQRYIVGLVIEAALVAALNTMALFLLGIDYAILIGILGALLNVIPYIGGLVAVAIPIMVALATKSSPWFAVYILVAYYVIQLVDNNYIVPKIVASKVKINALFSIIVVLAGNAIWGVPGMFLAIPLLAIVKLICDHIEPLKPWGFLLGDTMPALLMIKLKSKKKRKAGV